MDNRGQLAAGAFPPGSIMNGMPVKYRLSAFRFLTDVAFDAAHQGVGDVAVTAHDDLPRLASAYRQRLAGVPYLGTSAGVEAAAVTVEYTEGGRRFRDRMFTVIMDFGAIGAGMWQNDDTVVFRAPVDEWDRWEPVLGVVSASVQVNPQWLAGEIRGQAQRSQVVLDVQREVNRIGEEIASHQARTNAEIHNDVFLTLTEQEEYVNPYSGETEVDSGDWRNRWQAADGSVVFTDDSSYDPNTALNPPFNRTDFRRSQVRPR